MKLCCSFKQIQLFTLMIATVTIISVLVILFLHSYPSFARQKLIDQMVFKNGTESILRFQTTKEVKNMRLSFYLFSVTNADEVVKSSAKINLKEIGPFVYDELKTKEFIDNNQTSGLITFKLRRKYTLNKSLSVSDPNTTLVTWPNVPLLVCKRYIDQHPFLKSLVYKFINDNIKDLNETPFISDTVANFLFDGSKRDLFEVLQKKDTFHFVDPWPLKDNKFALLYEKKNALFKHPLTVSAGFGTKSTINDLNQYKLYDGLPTLPYWNSEPKSCNQFSGTDGQFFSPLLEDGGQLEVYSLDTCRKMKFKYNQTQYFRGVSASIYHFDPKSFASAAKNPENKCYCLEGEDSYECKLDGLVDQARCSAPQIVLSGAHFFAGSDELLTRLTGLTPPNATIHQPKLFVEPTTGMTIKARAAIQLNVRLEKNGYNIFNFFKDSDPLILPLLWIEETSEMTDEQATKLKAGLMFLTSWLVSMVLGGAIVLIISIFAIATILCLSFRNSRNSGSGENDPLIRSGSHEDEERAATTNDGRIYQAI